MPQSASQISSGTIAPTLREPQRDTKEVMVLGTVVLFLGGLLAAAWYYGQASDQTTATPTTIVNQTEASTTHPTQVATPAVSTSDIVHADIYFEVSRKELTDEGKAQLTTQADMLKQHEKRVDPRLFVSWYSGTIEEANPSLNGPLGPTLEDVLDAQRSLPSWIFRRLCLNLPGQPDGAAFDAGKVEEAVIKGRTVLPPQPGVTYRPFTDQAGGGYDDATLGIAHEHEGVAVLDLLIDQGQRVNNTYSPEETVKKFADVLKQYGCATVTGDRYAGEWPREQFRKHGITYQPAELNRSQIYASLEPLINSGRVELLDHPKLFPQLIGLIRKGEKIDHANGEHDDHSNAAAGALVLSVGKRLLTLEDIFGDVSDFVDPDAAEEKAKQGDQAIIETCLKSGAWFPGE